VSVYDITGGKEDLLDSLTIDRMKTYTSQLPMDGNFSVETFFRVVCDKPVAVLMSSGNLMETGVSVGGQNIFYPSTDGGFAGNEFVFVAIPATSLTAREGLDHAVFAVEDSTIQLRDRDDEILRTLNIAANSSKRLELFSNKVYRITSTGRIMISSWTMWSFTICPSPMGGYCGRVFLLSPDQRATYGSAVVLIVSQENPVEVDIYDLSSGSLLIEKSLQSREMWFINREVADLEGVRLMVQSDEDVVVYAGSTLVPEETSYSPGQIANGIAFLTVVANRPTTIFSVSDAYVFSPNGNAELRINGLTITVPRGSYKNLPTGSIAVTSNETVIVQSISNVNYVQHPWTSTLFEYAGIRNFATYLLPSNRLEVTYPPPKQGERGSDGAPSVYMILAIAVVCGCAGLVVLLRRKSWFQTSFTHDNYWH